LSIDPLIGKKGNSKRTERDEGDEGRDEGCGVESR